MTIKTKVALVLDSSTVVIPLGSKNRIEEGMTFKLYSLGDMIFDPESGVELERVIISRGRGRVISVQEKISVVECFEFIGRNSILALNNISQNIKRGEFKSAKVGDVAEQEDRIIDFR